MSGNEWVLVLERNPWEVRQNWFLSLTSSKIPVTTVPALGAAATVMGSNSPPLSGSASSSPPASGSLLYAGVARVLF